MIWEVVITASCVLVLLGGGGFLVYLLKQRQASDRRYDSHSGGDGYF
jgi:hypothetical protein